MSRRRSIPSDIPPDPAAESSAESPQNQATPPPSLAPPAPPSPPPPKTWLALRKAAAFLDKSPAALRRRLERHAVRSPDGTIEAHFNGIIGRKLDTSWCVFLTDAWTSPTNVVGFEARGARIGRKGTTR